MSKYSFLMLYKNLVLIDYINKKTREVLNKENIKIINVPFDEMNINEKIETNKSVGVFRYLKDESLIEYENMINEYKKLNINISDSETYPRIEISEKGNIFDILHELGHYFIYKRKGVQSEANANLFIEEFFDNYLPPFLKWIYQIEINVRSNKILKYTSLDNYNNYHKYIKNKNKLCI